jgi:large subunit ribosomal protein L21
MYAVIETGGKQYRVEPGDVLDVERLAEPGEDGSVELDRVLLVGDDDGVRVGTPVVDGASVRASLVRDTRGPKIRIFKYKRRKGFRRTKGHRQELHRIRIEDIQA